jgi:phage FluMu protein Com
MVFSPNDSPLAGREGTHLTGSKIGDRLKAEAATSVSLRVRCPRNKTLAPCHSASRVIRQNKSLQLDRSKKSDQASYCKLVMNDLDDTASLLSLFHGMCAGVASG